MSDAAATPDQVENFEAEANAAPVAKTNRLANLDFIRGIAVLGILAANIVFFGQPQLAYMWPEAFVSDAGDPDRWMWIAQFVLVDGKMRGLFTILFGVGLVLFIEKAWEKGSGKGLLARRLVVLLGFGLIHYFFIWRGDILTLYALAGLVALIFLRWEARNLLVLGFLGYLVGGLLWVIMNLIPLVAIAPGAADDPKLGPMVGKMDTQKGELIGDKATETAIHTTGSWPDFVAHNFTEHWTEPFFNAPFMIVFETLPLILIGMGFFRAGLFSGGFARRKQLLWGWAGIVGGSILTLALAVPVANTGPSFWMSMTAFTSFLHYPKFPVILGLTAVLAIYGAQARGWLAERLSAAGRAAFTNYLGTSVLMMLFFHPWAGGLWGELSRPELYLVVALGWAVMLAWSKPWLEKYRYGPLEWLWRCLTYGKRFSMRR
ncbi:MAG: DUF418 domain-containing protein [Alteraurantiacibacter sp.]